MNTMADFDAWRERAQFFDYKGQRIAWWREGQADKPNLLLIHGFPTASWDWHAIWQPLAERFNLLAIDLIGFGYSAKPRAYAYSIVDQADLWEAACQHFGIKQTHVLAHDYGDTVAQELLARDSEGSLSFALESLCLLNGGLFPETHRATRAQKLLHSPLGALVSRLMTESSFRRGFSGVFGPNTQPDDASLKQFWALVTAGEHSAPIAYKIIRYITERRENRERWVGILQKTQRPLRVICGELDPVSGRHMADRYKELVPNPDVVLLEGIGHYPQCEAPQAVLEAFVDFHAAIPS